MLEDIAIVNRRNCRYSEDLGLDLKDATMQVLGQSAKVAVDKDYYRRRCR